MRINLNENWTLTNRERCYVLSKRVVRQEGKHVGEEILMDDSYYSDLKSALSRIPERVVLSESQATSFSELLAEIAKYHKMVSDFIKTGT